MNFLGLDISENVQYDGSVWKEYRTSSDITLIVTQAFHTLMKQWDTNVLNDEARVWKRLLKILHKYREAFENGHYDEIRDFMIKWWEAEFCCLWDTNLGVREVRDDGVDQKRNTRNLSKMFKMDTIDHLLNLGSLPRWIQTPHLYAMLNIPKTEEEDGYSKNFILMEKIDHGVTVVDITDKKPRNSAMRDAIVREFWPYYGFTSIDDPAYAPFKKEVEEKYEELVIRLKATFLENKTNLPEGLKFEDIFADLFERNVLITYNSTPIGGSRISFWIIDQ